MPLRRQLLQSALDYYQGFLAEQRDDPGVQAEIAATYWRVGQLRAAMGSRESWIEPYQKGVEIVQKLVDSNVPAADLGTLQWGVARESGISVPSVGNPAEAHATFLKAQRIWEKLVKENPTVTGFQSDLASICNILGILDNYMGKPADAAREYEKACQLWENLVQANVASPETRDGLATGLDNLGEAYLALNRRQEAEKAKRKGIALQEKLTAEFPAVPAYRRDLATIYTRLSGVLLSAGQTSEALAIKEKELSTWEQLAASHPTVTDYRTGLVSCRLDFADLLQKSGRTREAEQILERHLAELSMAIQLEPTNASLWDRRANVYGYFGRWDNALRDYVHVTELYPREHWYWYYRSALELYLGDVDGYRRSCREMLKRFGSTDDLYIAVRTAMTCSLSPDAVSDFDPVLKLAGLAVEKNSSYGWAIFAKGLAEYRARHYAGAVDMLKREQWRAGKFPLHFQAAAFAVLAMACHQLSQTEEARTALGQARSILANKMPKTEKGEHWHDWLRAQILYREAEALMGIGNRNTQHKDTKDTKKKP
jgi:tetratricopeptide (TPR) repeat protein